MKLIKESLDKIDLTIGLWKINFNNLSSLRIKQDEK